MNLSGPFIRRPVATILLTIGLAMAGIAAFFVLPVSPLPQVDFPTVSVSANLSGASPQTMASSVATPLERRLGTISGVNEMTSQSSTGSTRITLQFDLNRQIDGAAREVQAAINAARADLPATLRSNPTYRKANPSDSPVIILALTSDSKTPGQIYDAVSNVVAQRLAQVSGVGDVEIGGGSLPAVRISANPFLLNQYGVAMEDVRAAIQSANANRPKGALEGNGQRYQIYTTGAGRKAADYAGLVVAWRNGAPIRLSDVAQVTDSVADTRTLGLFNGKPSIIVLITAQPGANIIETVDSVRAVLPELRAQLPSDITVDVASDRTNSIRASLHEIEVTLLISIILVIVVVSVFLRSARATFIPAAATIVSLLGTFGVMYLLGFSLNNLSLMAITVATGFVVDDAIVVLENTARHIEKGMDRFAAALLGAREVGFTVLSISISLVAVFIPLLFMGGQVGRLFREFAVTLSAAVLISLVISLTTTPMMCAYLLRPEKKDKEGRLSRFFETAFNRVHKTYEHSLDWALHAKPLVIALLVAVIAMTAWLYIAVPKGFFPQQDSGQLMAGMRADQSVSSQAMQKKLRQVVGIIHKDPAVDTVVGFTGGGRAGGGFMFVNLKPIGERKEKGSAVIARLRPQLQRVTGISVFLNPVQDLRMGGRQSNSTYQYTLTSDNSAALKEWAAKLAEAMKARSDVLTDVDSDQQENGVETLVTIDRDSASRLGITPRAVDNALYNAFGQRQVATIYEDVNQYAVILEWQQKFAQGPEALNDVHVPTRPSGTAKATGPSVNPALRDQSTGSALNTSATAMTPLSAIASVAQNATPTSVNHQNGELATTVSFNLADGKSLSDAQVAVAQAEAEIGMPTSVRGSFQGQARQANDQMKQQPLLILAAIVAIYIVLGILYESYVHPITVLSTLPAAGVGAVVALLIFKMEFSIIALIGVFLLLGIVKKNAILIIDFALDAQRSRGLSAQEAVREASLLRFRPILMTTLAAALGALPLAIGFGEGAELRRPLGVAIIGGLIASQLLTLITTPVVYVYLDRLRGKTRKDERHLTHHPTAPEPAR
ncbi:efflux RND transporter permease subunit [Caulobacter sp. 602-1]|uniref:efflux RND transporter permease subunit n=1 Tax=Caulobacter sp. 602-1 TaxID=2492472 RepID=UPI000F638A66|nr:efflux RND transporter permease subunit [Caulobacter sp. 602-1]RRN65396.1 nodulation protein [Caulobacter sp. 602-1]